MYAPRYFASLGLISQNPNSMSKENIEKVDTLIELVKNDVSQSYFEDAVRTQFPTLNLETKGSSGWNCLHFACQYENAEIVKFLIEKKKVNPNCISKDSWTPLTIAAHIGSYIILEILIQDNRTQLDLMPSVERGTALHVAAFEKNY